MSRDLPGANALGRIAETPAKDATCESVRCSARRSDAGRLPGRPDPPSVGLRTRVTALAVAQEPVECIESTARLSESWTRSSIQGCLTLLA